MLEKAVNPYPNPYLRIKTCAHCGRQYVPDAPQQKYCTLECFADNRRAYNYNYRRTEEQKKKDRWRRQHISAERRQHQREYAARRRLDPAYNYRCYMNNAAKRGHKFDISYDMFVDLVDKPCYYCGHTHKLGQKWNGLDRVNNDGHYTVDNVVSCCSKCNNAKHKRTARDFIDHAARIYLHQKTNERQRQKADQATSTISPSLQKVEPMIKTEQYKEVG